MQGFVERGVMAGWKAGGPVFLTGSSFSVHSRRLVFSLRRDSSSHGPATTSASGGNSSGQGSSPGNKYLLSGATIATLFMLGGLHARRLYDDQKSEQARRQGMEPEFQPDLKSAFLQILPLRLISRAFGMLTSVELPVWSRPYIFRGYCRAFHANLEEVAGTLEDYASLQSFFVRRLKDGCRPLDSSSSCLISPVDGVMLQCGQIKGPGFSIEQVKGHSYSLKALLGGEPQDLLTLTCSDGASPDVGAKSLPAKLQGSSLFYCVLYLGPGDYHRVHSPVDWHVLYRRHISGRLFPVNERATRTIANLYVGNERVVLEGLWEKGFMALVAVGATNVGSIELTIEPDLKTNCANLFSSNSSRTSFRKYGDNGSCHFIEKGDEVAAFKLGSTVVLVFQAPRSEENSSGMHGNARGFKFCVKQGQRIQMGQAIGKW